MNQLQAIIAYINSDGFEKGYNLVYICPDCMNAVLSDEDQATQMDWGSVRVLDEKWNTCAIIDMVTWHDHKN